MAYNRAHFIKLKEEYSKKNLLAKKDAQAREEQLHARYPDIKAVDDELRLTGSKILAEAFKGKDGLEERIEKLKEENLLLQAKRESLFKLHGIPLDFSDVKYECNICMDTGFSNGNMCSCFKKALAKAAFEESGLGALLKDQSFETFDLSYYLDDKESYENMKKNLEKCLYISKNFSKNPCNLLFLGPTGLGKTHLSTSIARCLIEQGFSVVYNSAYNIFNDFNKEQFKGENGITEQYFDCDVLIIDDLGTEMTTPFTVSCLYNIINTRLNSGKCMIINSNITTGEIKNKYTDRIASRLFGCFEPLRFTGKDIRLKKLQM